MIKSLALSVAITLATSAASFVLAADCDEKASAPWTQSGKGIVAEASSQGARCDKAKIGLVLRGADGKVLLTFASTADTVMTFGEVKTKAAMKTTLASWLADGMKQMPTSDKLPDWKEKQDQPSDGEFPFYVDQGVKRPAYLAIRKAKLPMFCFVQGMESLGCAVLGPDGAVTKLGAQSFPG
jgi:hypothetical protein